MRYLILPILLIVGVLRGLAQDLHADGTKGIFDPKLHEKFVRESQSQSALSSPKRPINAYQPMTYLFINWTQGSLHPYSGTPQRAWLKYNAFNHQLVSRSIVGKAEIGHVVDMSLLREFTIGDSALGMRLTYRRYLSARVSKPSLRTAFFEVHYDIGKTALLCQRVHTPDLPQPGPSGFSGSQDVLSYFLKTADNHLVALNLNTPDVLEALGAAHTSTVAFYRQQQQLDLRKEADVVRLLVYVDSL